MTQVIKSFYRDILQGRRVVFAVLAHIPNFSSYSLNEDETVIEIHYLNNMTDRNDNG